MHESERLATPDCPNCPLVGAARSRIEELDGESFEVISKLEQLDVQKFYAKFAARHPGFSYNELAEMAREEYAAMKDFLLGELSEISEEQHQRTAFIEVFSHDCPLPTLATILSGDMGRISVAICHSPMIPDGERMELVTVLREHDVSDSSSSRNHPR